MGICAYVHICTPMCVCVQKHMHADIMHAERTWQKCWWQSNSLCVQNIMLGGW